MILEIEEISIFDYNYLCSAYPDDETFFLKYIISIKHMVETFDFFLYFSGLNITVIEVQKGVQMRNCCICCIDLNNNTLKILGTHFSYNEKMKEENTF